MTKPNQLRHNILAARAELDVVRQLLLAHENERHLGLGVECVRTADSLRDGVVFDLGKGLDIYAMTRNLSETNQSLRRIKSFTTIMVFGPPASK